MKGTPMQVRALTAAARGGGFTLVELMVVVLIISILAAIAVPTYQSQVRHSRRTDAKTAALDLAGREERFFSTNGAAYTNAPANLGYGGAFPQAIGSGYYQINVCVVAVGGGACAPSAAAGPSYTVTVTPVAGSPQLQDTACQSFSVDSTGQQWAFDGSGNANVATCWQK